MNYIELNGVKSTTVKGLLIQSLPSITKPQIRTEIETIDGRDGDIATKLGYAAYDKELSIGLYGDFNIDDVIRYFDSSGEVVFSNEPDKYYRYQILEQIDYERLLRFRTAKANFHVQPFKYSAVDRKFDIINQELHFKRWTAAQNGVTLTSDGEKISLSGSASRTTEFYMPIVPMQLAAGNYTFTASVNGTISDSVAVRLIAGSPSNSNTFGQTYISLQSGKSAEITASDAGTLTYNYLWFYIPSSNAVNFSVSLSVASGQRTTAEIINRGNTQSKPTITIYGSGNVGLTINGKAVLSVNIDDEYITVDAAEMNAYHDGVLKNRQVTGDYADVVLSTGNNLLSWTGNVTKMVVEDYSRWI